jgi:hypothetical protein
MSADELAAGVGLDDGEAASADVVWAVAANGISAALAALNRKRLRIEIAP